MRQAQVFGEQLTGPGQGQLGVAVVEMAGGQAQRLQMPPAGAEAALGRLFVAHAGFQVFAQQIQTLAGSGRETDGHMTVAADLQGNGFARQVRLVADQGDLGRSWPLIEKLRP
ncbi:hypothetical protein D3C85_1260480 [compost metagenome]